MKTLRLDCLQLHSRLILMLELIWIYIAGVNYIVTTCFLNLKVEDSFKLKFVFLLSESLLTGPSGIFFLKTKKFEVKTRNISFSDVSTWKFCQKDEIVFKKNLFFKRLRHFILDISNKFFRNQCLTRNIFLRRHWENTILCTLKYITKRSLF